jgi:hypothetical protein
MLSRRRLLAVAGVGEAAGFIEEGSGTDARSGTLNGAIAGIESAL